MKAGRTVQMMFDGDTAPTLVPVESVAAAYSHGGKLYKPSAAVRWLDAAPTIGGIGGSIAGGVAAPVANTALAAAFPPAAVSIPASPMAGRIAGGVAGGTLGKLIQEGGYRALGYGDAPGTVAGEAATQAVLGPIGEGAGAVMKVGGNALVRGAMVGRIKDAGKAAAEMISERLPIGGFNIAAGARKIPVIGPSLVRGSEEAGTLLSERKAARDLVNTQAGQQGVRVPSSPIKQAIKDMAKTFEGRSDRSAQLAPLKRRFKDFLVTWRNGSMSPTDAQKYLSSLDEEAKSIWEAASSGQRVSVAEKRVANQAQQVSKVVRNLMRNTVPGHEEVSEPLGRAAVAKGAVSMSEAAGLTPLATRFALGSGLTATADALSGSHDYKRMGIKSALAGGVMASPATMSRLALLATDPLIVAAMRQAPRFFAPPPDVTRQ